MRTYVAILQIEHSNFKLPIRSNTLNGGDNEGIPKATTHANHHCS
jgi:hypothetical protein